MFTRRPSVHVNSSSSTSSTASSLKPPSVLTEDWDADDESAMSNPEGAPSRPLSLTIPNPLPAHHHGPYATRRPNLKEILANTSPAPWTLAAFMAYLSTNHCLETLEFIMDAGRYKKHYGKMMSRANEDALPPLKDRDYVHGLWRRLLEAYIQQNGSREVNLPSHVRDPILNHPLSTLPPSPHTLDSAVATIYELMEESVLVPFLNSMHPMSAHPQLSQSLYGGSDDHLPYTAPTTDSFSVHSRWTRSSRSSPPPRNPHDALPLPQHPSQRRKHSPAPLETSPTKSRFSVKSVPTSTSPGPNSPTFFPQSYCALDASHWNPGSTSGPNLTDDSGSMYSPSNESPMTPPTSPPTSDINGTKRDSGMWRKLGRLGGLKPKERKRIGREQQLAEDS